MRNRRGSIRYPLRRGTLADENRTGTLIPFLTDRHARQEHRRDRRERTRGLRASDPASARNAAGRWIPRVSAGVVPVIPPGGRGDGGLRRVACCEDGRNRGPGGSGADPRGGGPGKGDDTGRNGGCERERSSE